MVQCPKCRSSIEIPEQSYGASFTCPDCQAFFFIDWNGQPENPPDEVEIAAALSADPPAPFVEHFQVDPMPTTMPLETAPPRDLPSPPASDLSDLFSPYDSPPPLPFHDLPVSVDDPLNSAIKASPSPDFNEIVEFGNDVRNDQSINYTVYIKGIEISDLREQFREAIMDQRFGWNTEEVISQIKNGSVVLYDLSPAKAVVLINRIKYLGLDVSWKQNILS